MKPRQSSKLRRLLANACRRVAGVFANRRFLVARRDNVHRPSRYHARFRYPALAEIAFLRTGWLHNRSYAGTPHPRSSCPLLPEEFEICIDSRVVLRIVRARLCKTVPSRRATRIIRRNGAAPIRCPTARLADLQLDSLRGQPGCAPSWCWLRPDRFETCFSMFFASHHVSPSRRPMPKHHRTR